MEELLMSTQTLKKSMELFSDVITIASNLFIYIAIFLLASNGNRDTALILAGCGIACILFSLFSSREIKKLNKQEKKIKKLIKEKEEGEE